jgi:hypothetical protein
MLKLKEDSKRVPFGGHHYPEYGMTFKGESFKEVAEKLTDFRLRNNIPKGDPEQEVLNFYADHWPWLVREDRDSPAPDDKHDQYFRWRDWIFRAWKKPPTKLITPKEAKDRWAACEFCPFNEQFKWDESDESAELNRRTFLLRRGIETPEYLGFCACHGSDLASFSFFEAAHEYSRKELEKKQPAACWVKDL